MQELKVIGVENGALLAASDDGARFRIEIDEVLQSRIRQAQPEVHTGPKPSPREVQAHIRAGMSAEEVAQVTGAAVDYIRRFEGPVLAERDPDKMSGVVDVEDADNPGGFDLPGADLSDVELDVVVLPPQADEFTCVNCFLVKHRSQIDHETKLGPICMECAS